MIYVVTGYMRTGTSMMMQALAAGGLTPAFAPERETMNARFGDEHYRPNAGGFYEVALSEYEEAGFPLAYEGKLIKVLDWAVARMAPHEYRVVYMRRDPEEIRQSFEAAFGSRLDVSHYEARTARNIALLNNRKDVQLVVCSYRQVIRNPSAHFLGLWEEGWPVDVDAAAAAIDPARCRFRRELLVEGA
jgi:hypothetical protein